MTPENYTLFFLLTLGNSTSFLINPSCKFQMLFLWYPRKFHILNSPPPYPPCLDFFWNSPWYSRGVLRCAPLILAFTYPASPFQILSNQPPSPSFPVTSNPQPHCFFCCLFLWLNVKLIFHNVFSKIIWGYNNVRP